MAWLVPFLAGAVGALFAAKVWGQWSVRHRPHQLAWAVGLTMYALASFVDAYVDTAGWNVPLYRVYFALAAGNVGFLGLGTILLTRAKNWRYAFAALIAAGLALVAFGQFLVPLDASTPVTVEDETRAFSDWGSEIGAKPIPFPNVARIAFIALNAGGGLALIGGSLLSWSQTRRVGVLLIGVGATFPALGGTLSTLFASDLRTLMQFLGIGVMFAGYLSGREATPPREAPHAAGE